MIGFYSPIFLLQIFCLYHVYSNSKEYKWYILILFLPLLGSAIYLYIHFFNQRNIDLVTDTIETAFTSDPAIKKLEKALQFSDTINNRINLANEYLIRGRARDAIEHYEACLTGPHKNDATILIKLLQAYFLEKNYDKVVSIGEQIKGDVNFQKSTERVSYALALEYTGHTEAAKADFKQMDVTYANYAQRYAYARFLHTTGQEQASRNKLETLREEISQMDRTTKRLQQKVIREINAAHRNGWG